MERFATTRVFTARGRYGNKLCNQSVSEVCGFRLAFKVALIAGLLLLQNLFIVPAKGADAAVIIEETRPALVVLISADAKHHAKSFGTGFLLSENGVIATARHVAQAEENLVAVTRDGIMHRVTRFMGENRDFDVALVKIEGTGYPCLRLAPSLPHISEWLAIATPTDQWNELFERKSAAPSICTTGQVASVSALVPGMWPIVTTSIPVQHGQSGSPLVNERAEVVGIVPYLSAQKHATAAPKMVIERMLAHSKDLPFESRPRKGSKIPLILDPDFRNSVIALQKQDWKAAEKRMKRVQRKFPESPAAATMLAGLYAQRQSWEQVRKVCLQVLPANEDNAMLRNLLGTSLIVLNHPADGLLELRRAIALGLEDQNMLLSSWELIATTESQLDHKKQADEAHQQVKELRQPLGK
jgi:hypothetical protein